MGKAVGKIDITEVMNVEQWIKKLYVLYLLDLQKTFNVWGALRNPLSVGKKAVVLGCEWGIIEYQRTFQSCSAHPPFCRSLSIITIVFVIIVFVVIVVTSLQHQSYLASIPSSSARSYIACRKSLASVGFSTRHLQRVQSLPLESLNVNSC